MYDAIIRNGRDDVPHWGEALYLHHRPSAQSNPRRYFNPCRPLLYHSTLTPHDPLSNPFSSSSLTIDHANGWYTNGVLNWNTNLTHSLQQYSSRHDDITLSLYDSSRIFNRVLDDPQGYGFVDSNKICSTGECVWFDNFHPGSAFYKVFARDFAEFLEERVFTEGSVG